MTPYPHVHFDAPTSTASCAGCGCTFPLREICWTTPLDADPADAELLAQQCLTWLNKHAACRPASPPTRAT